MRLIENIPELKKVLIAWQEPNVEFNEKATGTRYVVGEILNNNGAVTLNYFDNEDINQAIERGFTGLTAFPISQGKSHSNNVIDILSKRLPPSSRSDYKEFLHSFRISPESVKNTPELSLLAYTRGKLAGDGFSFYPTFEDVESPFEFSLEIAGFRHNGLKHFDNPIDLKDKDVELVPDTNKYDKNAVSIICDEKILGFVPKGLQTSVRYLLEKYHLKANIERINGTVERPNILAFVEVKG